MPSHPVRNTVLVLLAIVVSAAALYSLTLYGQRLDSADSEHERSFWQLLKSDLAHKKITIGQALKK